MTTASREDWKRLESLLIELRRKAEAHPSQYHPDKALGHLDRAIALIQPYLDHPENAGNRLFRELIDILEQFGSHYMHFPEGDYLLPPLRYVQETVVAMWSGKELPESPKPPRRPGRPRGSRKKGIPVPDPLGILEGLTDGRLFDPLLSSLQAAREDEPEPPTAGESMEGQVRVYITLLEQAYKVAPCASCRGKVESALVAAYVYQEIQRSGKSVEQITEDDLDRIRKEVKERLNTL